MVNGHLWIPLANVSSGASEIHQGARVEMGTHERRESMASTTGFVRSLLTMRTDLGDIPPVTRLAYWTVSQTAIKMGKQGRT